MYTQKFAWTGLMFIPLFLVACGGRAELTQETPVAGTVAASTATDTPIPPTNSPVPPTNTPILPTNTLEAVETQVPTPTDEPAPPTVDEILDSLGDLSLDEFLDESFRQLRLRDTDNLFFNGYSELYGVPPSPQFTDLSLEYIQETQSLESGVLDLLRSFDRQTISPEQRISYDTYEWYLGMLVRGHVYADYKFLVNPVWGLQNLPVELLNEFPMENQQDAENYITRISNLDTWTEQVIAGLARNKAAGAVPPRYVLEDTIAQIDEILKVQQGDAPIAKILDVYTNFRAKLTQIDGISDEERDALLDAALVEFEETFIPSYLALRKELDRLASDAVEDPNEWQLPGGDDYYNYLLEYYSGTQMGADEIHTRAQAEVARIQADLRRAALELGYPSGISMEELNQRMIEDSQIVSGSELLTMYEQILSTADRAAADYFDMRSSAGVQIRTVSDGPPAYYAPPEPGSSDPGEMVTNLSFSPLVVNYNEHVLVHHETIPGHHTQISLAQEIEVPGFQRYYGVNPFRQEYILQAYAEGWALYGETLAWEMGLYEGDPIANLGRLRLHLLRAVRSVVDTGIHARGWTMDEAAQYLETVTGMPQNYASLTRYLVNPGYPNGYTIGAWKIFDLRQRAQEQLGEAFDIREFHNQVLSRGNLPIGVLETVVEDWIEIQSSQ